MAKEEANYQQQLLEHIIEKSNLQEYFFLILSPNFASAALGLHVFTAICCFLILIITLKRRNVSNSSRRDTRGSGTEPDTDPEPDGASTSLPNSTREWPNAIASLPWKGREDKTQTDTTTTTVETTTTTIETTTAQTEAEEKEVGIPTVEEEEEEEEEEETQTLFLPLICLSLSCLKQDLYILFT